MGVLNSLEKRLGLPPLQEMTELISGSTGKRVESVVCRLEKLSQNGTVLKDTIALLQMIREMDEAGTLQRLLELLKELKGKQATEMLARLDRMVSVLGSLLKG